MPAANSPRVSDRDDLTALESLWEGVLADLRRRKELIDGEIRSYPTPIPRCDAQFNHLHEQQRRLALELDRIGAATGRLARTDYLVMIERFLASAPYGDEPAERALRSSVKARLRGLVERRRQGT